MASIDLAGEPATRSTMKERVLGLPALTALVVGSMVGAGVFSLPQNMAAGAGVLAVLLGWVVTGIGIAALALVYVRLAQRQPELNAGPYAYARAGFGPFIGFNSAWGYWLSAWIGNVSYAVVLFGAVGYFFDIFGEGNTLAAVIGASVMLWAIHALIAAGVRQAALVNLVTTIAKLAPIVLFVMVVIVGFKSDVFSLNWSGDGLGSVFEQMRSTMLVTLWVFIGVEGASVVSGRAKKRSDIGRATMYGFLFCLVLYALVSVLSYGALTQAELAELPNPSVAGVMEAVVGEWGAILINLALIVSVLGAFLAWTIFAAEIPYAAAKDGTMPRVFARENVSKTPILSLWVTNLLVQLFLVFAYFAESTYQGLFYIASTAILVPYVFTGAYAAKLGLTGEAYRAGERRGGDIAVGLVATIYGAWLVYAAGPQYLLMCALLYAPGIAVYIWARNEQRQRSFTFFEILLAIGLVAAAVVAAWLMIDGTISPL